MFEYDARNKEITQGQAEEIYDIPIRRVINKLKTSEKDYGKPGFQQIFSKEEEESFEKCVIGFCDWFPSHYVWFTNDRPCQLEQDRQKYIEISK